MARTNGTDNSLLEAALVGYQAQLNTIAAKITDIQKRLGHRGTRGAAAATSNEAPKKKHRMSAAGRARIAAAQRKRWAATKKTAQ